ncbi:MAG TPA: O-antigen ligase family protein [bacterium]|nr:O-antigen ligase family protein [bacterium]
MDQGSIQIREPLQGLIRVFEGLFLTFLVSQFLTAGLATDDFYTVRFWFCVLLVVLAIIYFKTKLWLIPSRSPTFFVFLCFLSFEFLRLAWAGYALHFTDVSAANLPYFKLYQSAPQLWFFYFAVFTLSLTFFSTRKRIYHLLIVMAVTAFLIAVSLIPPLLMKGEGRLGYEFGNGQESLFPPFFYFHEWIGRYVITRYAHVNWIGDIMAFGLFAALGMAFYAYETMRRNARKRKETLHEENKSKEMTPALLEWLAFFVIAAASVLLLARGTIISLTGGLLICFLGVPLKYRSLSRLWFVGIILIFIGIFLFWAGNLPRALKETETVIAELEPETPGTLDVTRDGIGRSIAIYSDFPLWGVGTHGYELIARYYERPQPDNTFSFANFQANNHYFQTLAEEGVGAFIYLVFLGVYLYEAITGLLRTQSRFKFLTALTLFSVTVMILIHASVHHLMSRFPVAVLMYVVMGAVLAIFRPDFENE